MQNGQVQAVSQPFSVDTLITSHAGGRHRRHGACAHHAWLGRPHADRYLYSADCHREARKEVQHGVDGDKAGRDAGGPVL